MMPSIMKSRIALAVLAMPMVMASQSDTGTGTNSSTLLWLKTAADYFKSWIGQTAQSPPAAQTTESDSESDSANPSTTNTPQENSNQKIGYESIIESLRQFTKISRLSEFQGGPGLNQVVTELLPRKHAEFVWSEDASFINKLFAAESLATTFCSRKYKREMYVCPHENCKKTLHYVPSDELYPGEQTFCDMCDKDVDKTKNIWHCSSAKHDGLGYDICDRCAEKCEPCLDDELEKHVNSLKTFLDAKMSDLRYVGKYDHFVRGTPHYKAKYFKPYQQLNGNDGKGTDIEFIFRQPCDFSKLRQNVFKDGLELQKRGIYHYTESHGIDVTYLAKIKEFRKEVRKLRNKFHWMSLADIPVYAPANLIGFRGDFKVGTDSFKVNVSVDTESEVHPEMDDEYFMPRDDFPNIPITDLKKQILELSGHVGNPEERILGMYDSGSEIKRKVNVQLWVNGKALPMFSLEMTLKINWTAGHDDEQYNTLIGNEL